MKVSLACSDRHTLRLKITTEKEDPDRPRVAAIMDTALVEKAHVGPWCYEIPAVTATLSIICELRRTWMLTVIQMRHWASL